MGSSPYPTDTKQVKDESKSNEPPINEWSTAKWCQTSSARYDRKKWFSLFWRLPIIFDHPRKSSIWRRWFPHNLQRSLYFGGGDSIETGANGPPFPSNMTPLQQMLCLSDPLNKTAKFGVLGDCLAVSQRTYKLTQSKSTLTIPIQPSPESN